MHSFTFAVPHVDATQVAQLNSALLHLQHRNEFVPVSNLSEWVFVQQLIWMQLETNTTKISCNIRTHAHRVSHSFMFCSKLFELRAQLFRMRRRSKLLFRHVGKRSFCISHTVYKSSLPSFKFKSKFKTNSNE